ncbi:MAG TPA: hypothetical protein VF219_16125, partial [Vicinamibacterales bacterium]
MDRTWRTAQACDDRTSLVVNIQHVGDILVKIDHARSTAVVDFPAMKLRRLAFIVITTLVCQAPLQQVDAWQAAARSQDPKPQLPKSQIPDLGRPTRPTDEQPLLNFGEYFIGKWNFEWDVPEGPLGTSGVVKGSVVFKHVDGPFFEATTAAKGPDGAMSIKETIAYRAEGRTAARWVVDSRGFTYSQVASVGG